MDYIEIAKIETCMFPEENIINEEYILLSRTYMSLFGEVFLKKTGLKRLEARMSHKGYKFIKESDDETDDFYFHESTLGLNYFCFRCIARVERLREDEKNIVLEYCRNSGDNELLKKANDIVINTYKSVMVVDDENRDTMYSPRLTLWNEYEVKGGSIPLLLRSVPSYTEDGDIIDKDEEIKRQKNLLSIKNQIEPILSRNMECDVEVILKLF